MPKALLTDEPRSMWLNRACCAAIVAVATMLPQHSASAQRAESPDTLRERFRLQLAAGARAGSADRTADPLAPARATATAYATGWHDPVLLRQLTRFERWSHEERATKVAADSLRHAGFDLFPREGAAAAAVLWRLSFRLAQSIHDSAGIAAVAGNLGAAFLVEGELDSASAWLIRSRRVAERLDDRRTLGNALGALGNLEKSRSDFGAARRYYTQALAARKRSGDDRGAAADENNLGLVALAVGDTTSARRYFEAALARNRAARRAGPAATNLVNLANLAIANGNDTGAAVLLREALVLHRGAREAASAGLDLQGLGAIALRQGDYPAAIAALTDAAATLDATGPRADAISVRADLAEALAAAGELGRAAAIVDSIEHADAATLADEPALAASLAMLRGDLAADVGAADEAASAYARADSLYALAGNAAGSASARQGLGVLLLRGGDRAGAVRMLSAAAVVQREAGDVRAAALTGILAGAALADGGNAAEALRGLRRDRLTLRRIGDPVGEAAALSGLGDVEQREGRLTEAERDFRGGLAVLGTRPAPSVATSLHWGLGRARFRRGDPAGAVRQLQLAVNAMETMAARMPAGDHRTSLLGNASELYAELALVEHARGRDAAAFEVSEQLRARQMRELGPAGGRNGTGPMALAPVTQAAVASRLAPNEALLEYLVTDSLTLLFVVTRDSTRSIALSTGRAALRAAVDFARAAIARGPARTIGEPWAPPMRRLRRILIEPAESAGLLRGVRRLLIAPHAELHYLPFAALMSAGPAPYLVERYEIAYVPSAAVWLQFGDRQPAVGTSVLAVAPFPASLPGSRDETRAIGRLYGPDAAMMVGPEATQQAFTAAVAGRSVIHLATYGVLNRRNPSFSFVAFAPRPGDDGRLTVADVLRLSFRARLVVLSACETGLGSGVSADVPAGDDWVGLVRAFLVAGADNVMASLWPIEDRATSRIVPQVYAGLQRGDVTAALAAAQRAALSDPATSAPRHWAALVVVGAGRHGARGMSGATAP